MSRTNSAPLALTRRRTSARKPSEVLGGSEPLMTKQVMSSSESMSSNISCSLASLMAAPALTMLYSVSGPALRNTLTRVMPSDHTGLTGTPRASAPLTINSPEKPAKKPRIVVSTP